MEGEREGGRVYGSFGLRVKQAERAKLAHRSEKENRKNIKEHHLLYFFLKQKILFNFL